MTFRPASSRFPFEPSCLAGNFQWLPVDTAIFVRDTTSSIPSFPGGGGAELAGNYTLESRLLLEARLVKGSGEVVTATAFNDVVLQRRDTGRMVDIVAGIDGKYVNTHSGDGLIVATPTGSTAYALSCGGPIIEPKLDAVVIVPICPHTLTDRPIVVPASESIEIRVLEREDTKAEVTIDGHSLGEIRADDELTISAAEGRITLIHPPGYDFFGILRSKLFWGRDSRVRDGG